MSSWERSKVSLKKLSVSAWGSSSLLLLWLLLLFSLALIWLLLSLEALKVAQPLGFRG